MTRSPLIIASLATLLFCGCARHYTIRMTNGTTLQSVSKPRLNDRGFYIFKDSSGQEQQINSMRVREIGPSGSPSPEKRFYPGSK